MATGFFFFFCACRICDHKIGPSLNSVRLTHAEDDETGDMCALKTEFRGGYNSERERKRTNFAPTACFTNSAPRTNTFLERVRGSYGQRTPVALTVLHGTTKVKCKIH